MFRFKSLKLPFLRRKSSDYVSKIPLTERNIETLNSENGDHEQADEEDSDRNAHLKLQRTRSIQVSEWLRLLP